MTRGAAALAKGHFAEAFSFHPAIFVLAFEAFVVWVVWGAFALRGRRIPAAWSARVGPLAIAHATALFAFWLGRLATGTLPW